MATSNVTAGTATLYLTAGIGELVHHLGDVDPRSRVKARATLVLRGREAGPALAAALQSPDETVRWEAAKALTEIRDPKAAPALVTALEDDDPSVRWLAAEALALLGRNALEPLLHALITSHGSVWMRDGAHHVLREAGQGDLKLLLAPVMSALEGIVPAEAVMPAAHEVLKELELARRGRTRQT